MMRLLLISAVSLLAFTAAAPVSKAPMRISADWKWEVTVDVFEGAIQGFFSRSASTFLKLVQNHIHSGNA